MKNRFKFVVGMFIVAACVFFGLLLFTQNVKAMTILGDHGNCMSLARSVQTAVMMRDAGYKWENEVSDLVKAVNEAKGQPDSFVKDDDDAKLVVDLFGEIWTQNASVEDTVNAVYIACMASAKPV